MKKLRNNERILGIRRVLKGLMNGGSLKVNRMKWESKKYGF